MHAWAWILLGLSGILLAATSATAQQVESELTLVANAPSELLVPNGEARTLNVDWAYTPGPAAEAAIRGAGGEFDLAWNPSPACNAVGVLVTGPSSTPVQLPQVPQETYRGTQAFNVVATQDAPGETAIACSIGGVVASANSQTTQSSATAQFAVTVAYWSRLATNAAKTIDEAGPSGTITYDVDITNVGNSRTNVAIEAVNVADGWTVQVPEPFVLESSTQGGVETKRTVQILVTTPEAGGWNNQEATFRIVVTPTSTVTGEQGDSVVEVNFLSRVRGWSWAWPAPLYPLVLIALPVAVVLAVKRLRRKRPAKTTVLKSGRTAT